MYKCSFYILNLIEILACDITFKHQLDATHQFTLKCFMRAFVFVYICLQDHWQGVIQPLLIYFHIFWSTFSFLDKRYSPTATGMIKDQKNLLCSMWKWNRGPVVQSIVSLTKSLVNDSLSLLVCLKSSVLIFFAEKMWGTFALQKLPTFFWQKMAVFLCLICLKF